MKGFSRYLFSEILIRPTQAIKHTSNNVSLPVRIIDGYCLRSSQPGDLCMKILLCKRIRTHKVATVKQSMLQARLIPRWESGLRKLGITCGGGCKLRSCSIIAQTVVWLRSLPLYSERKENSKASFNGYVIVRKSITSRKIRLHAWTSKPQSIELHNPGTI